MNSPSLSIAPPRTAAARWRPSRSLIVGLVCAVILDLSAVLDQSRPTGRLDLCLFHSYTHLPCPGCGITHAIIAATHGRFLESVRYHPLGPLAWAAAVIGASSLLWPGRWKRRFAEAWARRAPRVDRAVIVGIALLTLFGGLRILFHFVAPPAWWIWS
jgi:hypothetical protein